MPNIFLFSDNASDKTIGHISSIYNSSSDLESIKRTIESFIKCALADAGFRYRRE